MAIEERLTYLEHQFEQLSDVVLGQGRDLQALTLELTRHRAMLEQLMDDDRGENLPHEKPPHY
jgi:uncharacterized coiled-coil protein SlyX